MGEGWYRLLQSVWIRLLFALSNSKVKYCLFKETLNPIPFEFRYIKRRHGRKEQSIVTDSLDLSTFALSGSRVKFCLFNGTRKLILFDFDTKREDMSEGCRGLFLSIWTCLNFGLNSLRVKFCLFNEPLNPIPFEFWYIKRRPGPRVQSVVTVSGFVYFCSK